MIPTMNRTVIARHSVPRTEAIVKRLVHNRIHLQEWLDHGTVRGGGGFRVALRHLAEAVDDGKEWAIRLAIEYSVGKPQQHRASMQFDEDGAAAIDGMTEIVETVAVTRKTRVAAGN